MRLSQQRDNLKSKKWLVFHRTHLSLNLQLRRLRNYWALRMGLLHDLQANVSSPVYRVNGNILFRLYLWNMDKRCQWAKFLLSCLYILRLRKFDLFRRPFFRLSLRIQRLIRRDSLSAQSSLDSLCSPVLSLLFQALGRCLTNSSSSFASETSQLSVVCGVDYQAHSPVCWFTSVERHQDSRTN